MEPLAPSHPPPCSSGRRQVLARCRQGLPACPEHVGLGRALGPPGGRLSLGPTTGGQFPKAAIAKDHKQAPSNSRNASSHSSGGQESKIEVLAGFVPSGAAREKMFQASFLTSGGCWPSSVSLAIQLPSNLCFFLCVCQTSLSCLL